MAGNKRKWEYGDKAPSNWREAAEVLRHNNKPKANNRVPLIGENGKIYSDDLEAVLKQLKEKK